MTPAVSRCLRAALGFAVLWGIADLAAADAASDAKADQALSAGIALSRAGRHDQALRELERASELRPDHADTWLELGLTHSRLKQWDAAIAAYRRCVALDPASARAWHNLGNVHYRIGDYDAAAEAYGRAVEIDPDYLLAAFHQGWTLRQLNRSEEAERVFRHCLDVPPRDDRDRKTLADCLFGLGSILHRRGDYASSAELMERVLAMHPRHPEARYYLAMAYRQLGKTEQAEHELALHRELLDTMRPTDPIEAPDEP